MSFSTHFARALVPGMLAGKTAGDKGTFPMAQTFPLCGTGGAFS